jgi:serine/threonine-protein kinase
VIAAGVVLLAVGTYGFSFTGRDGGGRDLTALPQPSVVPASGKCVVSYAVQSDANGEFVAEVTVANRAEAAVKDWRLWFIMPGDQVISGRGKVQLAQENRTITVRSQGPLAGLKSMTMPIYGRYTKNNAAPLAFALNNQTCEAFVSGKPGEPSRQVEHLSNGTVRLGAVPSTDNPIPGVSVGPGGVVTISPTIPRTTGPTPLPTTKPAQGSTTPPPTTPAATDTPNAPGPPPATTTAPAPVPTTPTPTEDLDATTPPPLPGGDDECIPEIDDNCVATVP